MLWDTPFQRREKHQTPNILKRLKNTKAPNNNKQLQSFVGLANVCGRMITDFASKMLLLKNMRKNNFSWGPMQQKASEDIKIEFSPNPLVHPYSLQIKATVTTDASGKTIGVILSRDGHPIIFV